jgi:polyisoprenoid-binding protein YceI
VTTTEATTLGADGGTAMSKEKWGFDITHSSVNFSIRHLMVSKVHGRFSQWNGGFEFDEANPVASHVEVQIEASSIDTKEPQRDTHLRSQEFFDVERYPHITFHSTSVEASSGKEYRITGDLTICGTTRSVVLDVEYAGRVKDPWGGERAGFTAKTTINRKDFGLSWNKAIEAGGVMVGDKVEISVDVEAVKAKA